MCVLVLQAISEKNLAEPTAVELTETLHDTAAILSRQSTCIWPPFLGGEGGERAGSRMFFLLPNYRTQWTHALLVFNYTYFSLVTELILRLRTSV